MIAPIGCVGSGAYGASTLSERDKLRFVFSRGRLGFKGSEGLTEIQKEVYEFVKSKGRVYIGAFAA